jgi:hypothetical protein
LGWIGLVWFGSGQEQVESSCEFGIAPLGSIKRWKLSNGLTTVGLSNSPQLNRVSYDMIMKT